MGPRSLIRAARERMRGVGADGGGDGLLAFLPRADEDEIVKTGGETPISRDPHCRIGPSRV